MTSPLSSLKTLIDTRSAEINLLYSKQRFFQYPEVKKNYLANLEKIPTDCWITARLCDDIFVEDEKGDLNVYFCCIGGELYHEFTLVQEKSSYFLIDAYYRKYTPRMLKLTEAEALLLLSSEWRDMSQSLFGETMEQDLSFLRYKERKARVDLSIIKID